jgi:prophage regulatory protein
MRLLGYRDLKSKGIPWSRMHVNRLIKQGKFPKPFKLGTGTNSWTEEEIDRFIETRIAKRDEAAGA